MLSWGCGGWDGEKWADFGNIWGMKSIGLGEELNMVGAGEGVLEMMPWLLVGNNERATVE